MVSPASFRHPSELAKVVTTADHVSGGRVELGMGTGWSEAEHKAYGFPFFSMRERMDVLAEQLEIVHDGHWGDQPFSFHGEHYTLEDLDARPKPIQRPHPPLIMGGKAGPRAARLAARFADEYNTVMPTLEEITELRANIVAACDQAGREAIPFSVMTGVLIGPDQASVDARTRQLAESRRQQPDPETWITGTVEPAAERLRSYEKAGVERIYLQHLLHSDLDAVELIGRELAPALA